MAWGDRGTKGSEVRGWSPAAMKFPEGGRALDNSMWAQGVGFASRSEGCCGQLGGSFHQTASRIGKRNSGHSNDFADLGIILVL
jgi:hypothetical protein